MATKKSAEYDADSVKHLGYRESVQQKTAMYMGSTDEHGIFTCIREVADNIIDEAINGHSSEGELIVFKDLEYWIRDNGRGMPVGPMKVRDSVTNAPHTVPALQAITSLLHAGGKLQDEEDSAYKISRGSHGCGIKGTNFLASFFKIYTFSSPATGKPKQWHYISYKNGALETPITKCTAPINPVTKKSVKTGTIVHFKVDTKFFSAKSFPPSLLLEYLQTSSYFTPGFTWTLTAAASGKTKTYHSENGALDYITEYKSKLPKVASMKPDSIFICSSPVMDVAVDFTTAEGNHLKGFTNGLFNAEGGDHVDSFFRTLQKSLEPYKKKGKDFTLTEIKEGVLGIVNAKLAAPKFSSQVKVKLQDERAAEPFRKLLQVELDKFFKKNKSLAESICLRCAELKNLRSKFLASKQVVMELRKIAKKGFPVKALMAPKCKASERELYLVEGDSAKGGITGVRNAHFQEVFPLKGKIMNAHRATSAKFFLNEEVLNILAMIGFDPKAADPYSNLRVSKLIFMTDADCDGPMTGNTRVMLCDGTSPTIKKLAEEGRDEFYVWAVDPDGLLVPAIARLPSHVKTVNQLYKLTFKDGTTVKCDASHKWFKTGMMDTPVKTPKLKVGDSIQSIYFRESGIRKLDKGERYLQWFDPRTRNYKFVHRRVKEAIDPVKYEKYMEINKGSVGGNVHIHHKDDRPLNNDPTNLKYIRKEKHWGHHGSKMSQDYNGSPKHKEDLARFYKNNPEHKINSAKNITEYNKSQAHRDVVSVMNTDPDILRKQFIGKCARMYAGLVHAKLDPSDHKNWFKYKLVNNKGNAIPSMSYYAMVNLGISLGEVKDYVTEAKIHERMEYTLLKLPEQTVEKKLQTMQDAFCRVGKRLEVDGLELSSENYEKYRTTLSRPSNTPKWEGALASFDGSIRLAKRAVKNFNHTITKIELLDCAPTPVYCMSVPGYKNFLIKDKHGNGIVTGNCHIAVLLLSMVHKYFPELIERGIIYIAEVPEFMAMVKGKPVYADSKEEMEQKLIELKATKAQVSHFKGLAEMEADILGAVGMNPATRMIRQITPTDSPTYNEDFISIVSGDASSRRTLLGI